MPGNIEDKSLSSHAVIARQSETSRSHLFINKKEILFQSFTGLIGSLWREELLHFFGINVAGKDACPNQWHVVRGQSAENIVHRVTLRRIGEPHDLLDMTVGDRDPVNRLSRVKRGMDVQVMAVR